MLGSDSLRRCCGDIWSEARDPAVGQALPGWPGGPVASWAGVRLSRGQPHRGPGILAPRQWEAGDSPAARACRGEACGRGAALGLRITDAPGSEEAHLAEGLRGMHRAFMSGGYGGGLWPPGLGGRGWGRSSYSAGPGVGAGRGAPGHVCIFPKDAHPTCTPGQWFSDSTVQQNQQGILRPSFWSLEHSPGSRGPGGVPGQGKDYSQGEKAWEL